MKNKKRLISTLALVIIVTMALTGSAFAYTGDAVVTASALNMRTGGGMEYEVIDAAPQGATVYVTADDGNGWCQVSYNGKTGYMATQYLSFSGGAETTEITFVGDNSGNASIQGTYVRFRSGPSLSSSVYGYLHTGTSVQVNGAVGEWYEVVCGGTTGYVYGDYVILNGSNAVYTVSTPATAVEYAPIYEEPAVQVATEVSAPAVQTIVEIAAEQTVYEVYEEPAPVYTSSYSPVGQQAVDMARSLEGIPYVWGGTSPEEGFDCSGLVYYVYGQLGYSLHRVAQSMCSDGAEVDIENDLQPGDILLFGDSEWSIYHAAIYAGNRTFIHAPYSGQVVSECSLDGYGLTLVAARRIL